MLPTFVFEYALKLLPGLVIRYMEALPLTSQNSMYAYIKNGAIACISHESLEIPDTEKREYNDCISNPILVDGEIVEYRDEEREKKERIQASLISSPHLETVDLE